MERVGSGALTSGDELSALLHLRLVPGLGDRGIARLLESAGSAVRALALPHDRFAALAGTRSGARGVEGRGDPALPERVRSILEICDGLGIRIVPWRDPGYPERLRMLTDPPAVLFLRGRIDLLDRPCVAVVGSRRATPTGRRAAERIGCELSAAGITIVSGLALGIDGAAHRGGLTGRGGTIAVLGRGPERAYPAGNRALFDQIVEEGLVVSEFPPGEPARAFNFPRRNRILASLSHAVVVVEAARRSGALITVDHALSLGLDVFAVPGSIEVPQSEGTNALLRDGAHVLMKPGDLLEAMGWEPVRSVSAEAESRDSDRRSTSRGDRGAILNGLGAVPRTLDQLVEAVGLPPAKILAVLTSLEVEGAARRDPSGWIMASEPAVGSRGRGFGDLRD